MVVVGGRGPDTVQGHEDGFGPVNLNGAVLIARPRPRTANGTTGA